MLHVLRSEIIDGSEVLSHITCLLTADYPLWRPGAIFGCDGMWTCDLGIKRKIICNGRGKDFLKCS